MLPLNRLLRIALPLGTATTAALITTILLSINRDDLDKKKENEDIQLNDFEDPVKEHKEEIISEPTEEGEEQLEKPDKDGPENGEESSEGDPVEASKVEITDLNEAVKNVVLEGVSSVGKIGQKGEGGVPKLNKEEMGPAIESKEKPLSGPSDSISSIPNSNEKFEESLGSIGENNDIGDGAQTDLSNKESVPTKPSDKEGKELQVAESGMENKEREQDSDTEETLEDSFSYGSDAPQVVNEEDSQVEGSPKGGEVESKATGSGTEDSPSLKSQPREQGLEERQESSPMGENPAGSDNEMGREDGVQGGNAENYSEKTIQELEGYEVELSFLEGKLNNFV